MTILRRLEGTYRLSSGTEIEVSGRGNVSVPKLEVVKQEATTTETPRKVSVKASKFQRLFQLVTFISAISTFGLFAVAAVFGYSSMLVTVFVAGMWIPLAIASLVLRFLW